MCHWELRCRLDKSFCLSVILCLHFQLPLPPPPPEELRDSRRNLTSSNNSVDTFAPLLKMHPSMTSSMTSFAGDASRVKAFSQLRHQPSAPDLFLNKVNRSSVQNFQKLSGSTRSYSTGKMNHLDNHVDWTRVSGLSTSTTTASSTASTSGRDKRVIKRSNSFRDSQNYPVNTDLAPGNFTKIVYSCRINFFLQLYYRNNSL